MRINQVKRALAEGKLQLGTGFGQLRSPEIPRLLAAAGFQWAFFDTEHGGFDLETVQDICRVVGAVRPLSHRARGRAAICPGGPRARLRRRWGDLSTRGIARVARAGHQLDEISARGRARLWVDCDPSRVRSR